MIMLCGSTMPADTAGPSTAQLMDQLEQERINRRAQRYIRDLRRDAVIEYN
jgi:peptidyl-prolyl cis-trans isomerase SurA